jgi:hypothetical protein
MATERQPTQQAEGWLRYAAPLVKTVDVCERYARHVRGSLDLGAAPNCFRNASTFSLEEQP